MAELTALTEVSDLNELSDPMTQHAWTTHTAETHYGLNAWGDGYFGVSSRGTIVVRPRGEADGPEIDLAQLIEGLAERGLTTPVVLRFGEIMRHRLERIRNAFDTAIANEGYQGGYSCLYPIKVNQQRHVCEEIRDIGGKLGFGLEAGSKPELWAVLGMTGDYPDMPIVCNGFKDEEYVETVILAAKLGRRIVPVVEQARELELIVREAERYGVEPRIGVRVKPATTGAGRWSSSGGQRSKFGLSAPELLAAVDYLKQRGKAHWLKMMHFHIGSQVCDIRQMKTALGELGRLYASVKQLGAGLDSLNVGGGLGIDYDGSSSAIESSVNYALEEYAADVVWRVKSACDDAGVPHPHLFSESGRAMAAFGSVLVFDVLGRTGPAGHVRPLAELRALLQTETDRPTPVESLLDCADRLTSGSLVEVYHDATQARDEVLSLFNLGYLSLPTRAAAEQMFWAICKGVAERTMALPEDERPEELLSLPEQMSEIYLANFSMFQSLPDSWAIDQLFPIAPIHRLNEEPTVLAVLGDTTCDSDGQIDMFIGRNAKGEHWKRSLELHPLIPDGGDAHSCEPYYLGVFLVGAYQETLGDLHNLFGDTHAVHISADSNGGWVIDEVVEGDTVKEVLEYVQYDVSQLRRSMRKEIERAVAAGTLNAREGRSLLTFYDSGLEGYTYLE